MKKQYRYRLLTQIKPKKQRVKQSVPVTIINIQYKDIDIELAYFAKEKLLFETKSGLGVCYRQPKGLKDAINIFNERIEQLYPALKENRFKTDFDAIEEVKYE